MSALRPSTLLWLAVIAAVGYGMFQVKYQVTALEDELARVNRSIDNDRDQLRVLGAEWSYLNQPARLDQLRQRYLTLVPIARGQLGSLDQIPFRTGEQGGAPPAPEVASPRPPAPPVALPGGAALANATRGGSR
jgi:hypothetical protein